MVYGALALGITTEQVLDFLRLSKDRQALGMKIIIALNGDCISLNIFTQMRPDQLLPPHDDNYDS